MVQHGAVTIAYDGDGNRVNETTGGTTTNYLVDTLNPTGYAQVVDELQAGIVTRSYAYGLQMIDERQPLAGSWKLSFYGYDGHGSVRYLTDNTGAITDTYDYDAFGNLLVSTGSTPNNYRFAGEQWDTNLGLYYNRARYLDVRSGRFWSMDDLKGQSQEPISLHRYLYVGDDPIDRIDPSGNDFVDFAVAAAISSVLAGGIGSVAGAIDTYLGGGDALQVADAAKAGAIQGLKIGPLLPIPLIGAAVTAGIYISSPRAAIGASRSWAVPVRATYFSKSSSRFARALNRP